ncbi:MAG: fructose-bisphosphate aldolase [Acidobacteria bacterium]|nr:fructose-bisphosphate aldolase [Acidobacteriota bacterium]
MQGVFATRRMHRIFGNDGRSLVVAMDHGSGLNVYPALTDAGHVIDDMVAGGADAILTTPGIAKQYPSDLRSVGLILRVDGGSSELSRGSMGYALLFTVEDALRLGADAVACMGFPGTELEAQTLENLAKLAGQCRSWSVPLMAEMVPGGFMNSELHTVENIRLAARIGVELGADFIKTPFAGSAESFQQVTAHCYRPVLVLGGSKKDDDRALFSMVKTALSAGAAGVVIGRNIWCHPRPRAVVATLSQLIHHNTSVEEALDTLASGSS